MTTMRTEPRRRMAAIGLSLALAMCMAGCRRDLPDRTGGEEQSEQQGTQATASTSPTATVTVTVDRTVAPDVATMSVRVPEGQTGDKDALTATDIVDLIVEQGADRNHVAVSDTDDTLVIAEGLSVRDAARARRELEEVGAKVESTTYGLADTSAIAKEAASEAYDKALEEADMLIDAVRKTDDMNAGIPTNIAMRPVEVTSHDESSVNVRMTLDVTFNVE